MVDDSGAEVGHVIYDAYGQIVENTVPLTLTDRLYTGQVVDASTGLYYYNARYYDPYLGQFTQPDSLVADALDPRAWNRFGYVYGNPVNFVDPSGHFPWVFVGAVAVAGLFNVGVGKLDAHLSGEQYTWSDAGRDFGIGAFFGALGYGVSARFAYAALRIPSYGILSVGEGMASSYFKGDPFTTNDALWAFGMGVGFAIGGRFISRYFDNRIGEMAGRLDVEQQYYTKSLRLTHNSIRAMKSANWEAASRIAEYRRAFPNSRLIRASGNYHMSRYVKWNRAIFQPPLPRPQPLQKLIAPIEGLSAISGAFLADNEYAGLFSPPPLIPNPSVLIPGR